MEEKTERGKRKRLPRSLAEVQAMGFQHTGDNYYYVSADETSVKGYAHWYIKAPSTPGTFLGKPAMFEGETLESVLVPFEATFKFGKPRRPRPGQQLP
jgi:GH43 family beta-xylosidase